MMEWQPIETAPKDGTIVELKSDQIPVVTHNMAWDGVQWSGLWFGMLGTREICWDYSTPPTHWRPIGPPKCGYCLQNHAADDTRVPIVRGKMSNYRPDCCHGVISLVVEVPPSERSDPANDIAEAYAVETGDDIPGGCIIWGKYRGEWIANVSGRWLISRFLKSK